MPQSGGHSECAGCMMRAEEEEGLRSRVKNKSLSVQTWCGGRVREAKVGLGVQLGAHPVRNRND